MGVQKTVPFRTNVSLCQSLFLKWNLCNGRDRDWQSYKKHTLAGRVGRMDMPIAAGMSVIYMTHVALGIAGEYECNEYV